MRYVQGISFPRSGHHLLVGCICDYFAAEMRCYQLKQRVTNHGKQKTSPWYKITSRFGKNVFAYCEFYENPQCNSHRCRHPNVKFHKSHDFELTDPIDADLPYLIQVREPLAAVVSYYELGLKKNRLESDNVEAWTAHANQAADYYRGFRKKWVDPGEKENRIIIQYEDFAKNTPATLEKALCFFNHTKPLDHHRIQQIARKVRAGRDIEEFKFYDKTFFDNIKDKCLG